ncbi:C-X-C motif chemokine 10-like isoform X2 [Periophthalmus magnuspinnatus]|uniref:C-X-C motif chemokine 10-like isoform X2 n=1 Tax=Periophthalmus magnuspinnatus TaxID=409849 RepID=UPI00145BA03B|nr:C-X-C motif chemokine 10-like isoform X2 [Periophthalmus magnuspinnatus]
MNDNSIRVLLVIAALAFICHAQQNQSGQQCLCSSVRNKVDVRRNISDIQIYPASDFCRQVEIVITNKQGGRYCLNPQLKAVKTFLTRMTGSKK